MGRGNGPANTFGSPTVAQEAAIDAITSDDMCGQKCRWGDSLLDTYTDGIVVLHGGRIV